MNKLRLTALFALLASALVAEDGPVKSQAPRLKAEGLLIVLDRSGSMDAYFASVQQHVKNLVASTPKDEPMGLIHFSGCEASTVVHEPAFGPNNHSKVVSVVGKLQSGGSTALSLALSQALGVMRSTGTCPQLVLFTDGEETCRDREAPIKVVREAAEFCKELNVNVVTSATEERVLELYQKLAQAGKGKGKVYQVDSLEEAAKVVAEITRTMKQTGQRAFSSLGQSRTTSSGTETTTTNDPMSKDPKKRPTATSTANQGQTQKKEEGDKK